MKTFRILSLAKAFPSVLFATLCLRLSAPAVHATVYLENLDNVILDVAPINATTWGGQSFMTDNSASAFTLDSITFSLGLAPLVFLSTPSLDGGGFHVNLPPSINFEVSLYANGANNTPGALIETLSGNTNPFTTDNYTYTSVGTLLQPNTVYWAIASVEASSSSEFYLNYTASTAFNGTWSTIGWTYTEDSGANWFAPDFTEPDMISINATPMPEPAAYAGLFAFTATVAALLRKRKLRCR